MSIVIQGFASTDKVPGFYAETVYGAGGISFASIPLYLLLTGNKGTGGSSTPDVSIDDVLSVTDADNLYQAGYELNRMCRAAIKIPGVRIKAAPVTEAGGGVQGTATITISGSPTGVGQWIYRIAGERVTGVVNTSDTPTTIAVAIKNAVNAIAKMPVTAANSSGVLTLTSKQAGARALRILVMQDTSQLAAGVSSVLGGGGVTTTNGIFLASAAGVDDITAMLATIYPGRFNRIATAQSDATNGALWKTQINAKAGVLEGRMEHVIMASSASLSAATTIAQTTLNDQRFQMLWLLNSETPPQEIAAVFGAMRVQAEQGTPNSGYDGKTLPGVVVQANAADWASRATQVSALDNSITPLLSQADGTVACVRAITTHSKSGSNPDYTCLDTAQAVVPDYVRDVLRLVWTTQFVVANPYVRNEPSSDEPRPPPGVAFPSLWVQEVTSQLRILERASILTQVSANLPVGDYDSVAQRIMMICPVVPLPLNHQVGVSVRQMNPA